MTSPLQKKPQYLHKWLCICVLGLYNFKITIKSQTNGEGCTETKSYMLRQEQVRNLDASGCSWKCHINYHLYVFILFCTWSESSPLPASLKCAIVWLFEEGLSWCCITQTKEDQCFSIQTRYLKFCIFWILVDIT